MQKPTDPYNQNSRRPFEDDDEVLAPIENPETAENSATTALNNAAEPLPTELPHETTSLAYGSAEALAWDKVFTAESAAAAGDAADLENDAPDFTPEAIFTPEAASETASETASVAAPAPAAALEAAAATAAEAATITEDGFNQLPEERRANANLHDLLSVHSADEASVDFAAAAPSATTVSTHNPSHLEAAPPQNSPALAEESAIDETPAVSIAAPLSVAASAASATAAAGNGADSVTAAANATSAPLAAGGFMQPVQSPAEEAARRARWEQSPAGYNAEDGIDLEEPQSRVWSHVGMFFLTLLLIPVCWYLLSDASIRLNLVENNPWDTNVVSFAALIELFGGLIALLLLILLARSSSLGAQFFGFVLTVVGLVALFIPQTVKSWIVDLDAAIGGINAFTGNVVHHLELDFASGRIAMFGIVLLASGLSVHLARGAGAERATIIERRRALGLDD